MARYNVVLMGKTGVGKSTLGNYLFGNNQFKTGTGKPVTSNGFHSLEFDLKGMPVTVFDSWGIEADKADQWMRELNNELKKRSTAADPTNWFHSVFYCVQASGHRIEDFEIKIIKKFIDEKYKVTVIFTKSDNVNEDELDGLKKVISKEFGNNVKCIEVSSEDKKRRDGSVSKAFGKEELVKNISLNFWNSISIRLPDRCISVMQDEVIKWKNKQLNYIKKEAGYFNGSEITTIINKESKKFFDKISKGSFVIDEVNKTLKMYNSFNSINHILLNSMSNNFISTIKFENRHWLAYFPTNLLYLAIFGRENTEKKLIDNIDKVCDEMNSKIEKMRPDLKRMIDGLKP